MAAGEQKVAARIKNFAADRQKLVMGSMIALDKMWIAGNLVG